MLIYQTLLYLPAQLLAPAIQLLAAVLWTHWLSPSEYGVLALIIAAQELISYVCLYWWSQYAIRYLASHVQGGSISKYQPTENIVLLASAILQVFAALIALALVDALQKLCHDAMCLAAGATPRYFATQTIATGAALPALTEWAASLRELTRHVEHPWNAGLLVESLIDEARRALATAAPG